MAAVALHSSVSAKLQTQLAPFITSGAAVGSLWLQMSMDESFPGVELWLSAIIFSHLVLSVDWGTFPQHASCTEWFPTFPIMHSISFRDCCELVAPADNRGQKQERASWGPKTCVAAMHPGLLSQQVNFYLVQKSACKHLGNNLAKQIDRLDYKSAIREIHLADLLNWFCMI